MAESMEAGIETHSMQTVLGMDDEGISTSDTYNVVVKDHGSKSGLKLDSVCITPAADITDDKVPEKTVQVLYTSDKEQHGGLNYVTVAVYENPREVDESVTQSKIVHLRSSKKSKADPESEEQNGVFSSDAETQSRILFGRTTDAKASNEQFGATASDLEAIKCIKVGPHPNANGASNDEEPEGIFASDPEALKYIRFGPKQGATGASSNDEQGIFASDPEALKYIKLGPKPGATGASSNDEPEGVFVSDPEALKYIKFGPKPGATGASSNDEPEGVFASDPEALKYTRFGPKPGASGASSNDEQGIFASDPEALKYIKFGSKPGATGASSNDEPEGVFLSDPEALKYIKFGPKPGATVASNNDEPAGVFASDPEALKYIKFGPKPGTTGAFNGSEANGIFASDTKDLKCIRLASRQEATGASLNEEPVGIFASDPDALECIGFGSKPSGSQEKVPPSTTNPKEIKLETASESDALEGEGDLLAEATGLKLKDNRTYSVRVTGHDLPDGQQKKFVSVSSADGRGGPTREEIDNLNVKVETSIGEDGMVENFVVVE